MWLKNVRAIVVCGFLKILKTYPENLEKIVVAVWELSAKKRSTHDFFQIFRIYFFKDFIKNPQTTIALTFLTHIISGIDGVEYFTYLNLAVKTLPECFAIPLEWLQKLGMLN